MKPNHQALIGIGLLLLGCADPNETDEYANVVFALEVIDFSPGPGAGFGMNAFPEIVLGPPEGGTPTVATLDVLSLGSGGQITLELEGPIEDHPGADFLVFENAFEYATDSIFEELGTVSVSEDGETFVSFPCSVDEPVGCAGRTPRRGDHKEWDPEVVGGDAYDLAQVNVASARFVRVQDLASHSPDGADAEPSGGFDLDGVVGFLR